MTLGAMKIKVKDSEKSSKLFLANAKEKTMLEKELRSLDISEKTVVNRISNNQKIVYRKFQRKVQRSEAGHARMKGAKEQEVELRQRQTKFNTSLADDDEVNEVLKRIWRTGSAKVARRRMKEKANGGSSVRPKSAIMFSSDSDNRLSLSKSVAAISPSGVKVQVERRPATATTMMKKSVTLQDGPPPRRPVTAWEMPSGSQGRGQYLVTGATEEPHSDTDNTRLQRPKTAPHMLSPGRPGTAEPRSSSSAAAFMHGNDPWEQARNELLDMHRNRLQAAQFQKRINVFCETVKPYTQDKERFIEDYYYARLVRDNIASPNDLYDISKNPKFRRHSSITPHEIRRATGDPTVRSLTLKSLNWNFTTIRPRHHVLFETASLNSEGNSADSSEGEESDN